MSRLTNLRLEMLLKLAATSRFGFAGVIVPRRQGFTLDKGHYIVRGFKVACSSDDRYSLSNLLKQNSAI